jgi:pimeloyl-ACP methyl ester carboxylesterase
MHGIPPPSRLRFWCEGRVVLELATLPFWLPALRRLPRGDGHPVLVLPGFLAGARSTGLLRWFLADRGYAPVAWRLGLNLGWYDVLGEAMNAHVRELHSRAGRRVSLVGWSLGGVYAREIARQLPDLVRQVITLGSPFRGRGTGHRAGRLYASIAGERPEDVDPELLERLEHPPPVPCTAIYSPSDGVVSARAASESLEHDRVENVAVHGSHFGLGANPGAWVTIADRLSQAEGTWRPFSPRGYQRWLCRRTAPPDPGRGSL